MDIMPEKTTNETCSVCGSGRQRHLVFVYLRFGRLYGSYTHHKVIKPSDVQCTRCILFSYRRYLSLWQKRHSEVFNTEWSAPSGYGKKPTDYSRIYRMLPDQIVPCNDFRQNHYKDFLFSLEKYNVQLPP